ncbi:MAG: Fur family transcriptional regulator [Prevotella sp.]|jgi:Fur family ferric uptake transcriptional regulator
MNTSTINKLLLAHGIKPTANRIVIARTLSAALSPMSMKDLENKILTIDKSGIFRTLTLFRDHHMVHDVEDGEGNVRYELCTCEQDEEDDDLHAHFFCEQCHRTFCLDDTPIPAIPLPDGFEMTSINYMVKGICPDCKKRGRGKA